MRITFIFAVPLLLALHLSPAVRIRAAEPAVNEEYKVKGAYLLNFTKFVDWPAQVFKAPGDPLCICVIGENPFGPAFEAAARDTVVNNHQVSIRHIADGRAAAACHIVFVSVSEHKRERKLLESVAGGNVLTVGESDDFLAKGGVIDFKIEGSRVRIEINVSAAEHAGLHINSKLLNLAKAHQTTAGQ